MGDPQPVYKNGVLIGYTYDGKSMTPVNKGAQEVYDKDKFIGITYDGKTMTPFEQPEPVKKKEVSGQGFWASQSASVPQSTSTKEAVINYIKEKLPAEAKTAPTTGISAVKPVKTNPFTQTREEAISHASNKLNEIMYANDDAWQDPLKAATVGAKNSATTKDALSHLGAKNLTEMSLAPDGYEAKKTLASTILGQMNDDNMTAVMLRQKAAKYDATVDGLRSINPNTVMGQGDISVGIRNAAIKSYANENPGFKKDIENAGYDINDPDLEFKLPQTKVGQIFNEYINNPNVAAYLQKENPELLPAFKATVDNMYRDNPEWGAVQIADELSKERTKRGLNEAFVNYYGKNDKEATNKIAEELYKDDPEKLALYNSRIRNHQEDYIDAPSLLSNTASGIKGIGNSMLNLVTQPFKSNKNIIDEKLEKEASNVSADPKGVLAFTSATGNVLGFLMGLGVTKNLSGLSELNSLSLATTGDIIQEAREKYPDNPVKATLSSGLNVILYRALGKNVFPVSKVGKAFSELKPEVGKIVENLANGSITKEAARQQASTLVKKAVDLVGGSAAKDVKISAELTGVQAANQLFDKLEMSDDEYKKSHPEGQLWDSFKHNLLSNAVVAGFAKYGEMKNANRAVSQSLYEAASNPKQYEREINNASVSLSYADVQEAKDNLKFIADTKKRLDAEGVKPQNQPRAIFEALQAKVKSETIPETGNKVLDKKTADEIKQHQEVQERILKGEDADTIITKAEQDKIDEQKENQIKLQRLQEDNKLSNEKFDKQLEGLDGRNPDDKLKIKEIELKRSRENEDFERESGKLKPKLTPEEAAKTITNDFYRNAIMADPEAGLKEAAQQLHSSKGEAETARKIYGDAFSDLALERYPTKEEAFAPQGITEVQLNETEEPLNWTNQDGRNKTINGRDWGEVVHEWFSNAKSNLSKFLKEKFGFAIENVNQSNWLNATKEENGLIATKQFDNGTLSLHTNGEFSFKDNKGDVTRFDKNGNVINEFSEIPQKQGITEVQPDAEGVKYWLDAADNEFGDDTKGKINFLKTLFDGNGEKAAPETSEKTKSDVKKAIEVLEQQASEPIPEPDNGKTNTEGEQQQLPPETARKIYGDAFSDLALERYPTKEEAFGTPQGITEVQPDENKVIYVQKFYPDKPNEELTERQINSVEKAISMGIEAGKSGDEIYAILNALGYAPANLSGMSENLREYLNDRVSGKDNRTFQETQSKIGNTTQEQQASEPIPEPDNGKINTEREQLPPEGGTPEPPASEPPTPEPPKPEPPKVEPEGGFVGKRKAILNRVFNGENTPQYIKDRMQEQGLDYVPVSHEESTEFAKSAIAEMGADEAIDKAESHSFPGGANTAVFTEVLNKLFDDEVNAKTPEEKLALAAKQADLYIRFDEYERKNGRDISAVNDFKKKSPLGLVMAQNEQKRTEYNDWAKKKDKSWKEYFNDLMKEPEFAKVFSEEVESKSKEIRVGERKSRREKVHKAIDDTMAKWAKKLSIDNPNDVKKAGGGDIKTILNAAGKTMKAAYDAGEAIAKVVKDAIDYISKELGHDNWPKEEFEKEWTAKLSSGKKVLTDEEIKGKVLDKFRKKLAGLSEKEKDEVIRRSYRKIVESGGLDYEEFREIIGRVTGRSEMTPEETAKFKELVEVSNSAAAAQSKLLAERTEKAHKEFLEAEKAASKARRELNEMIWNKPNIMQRLTSIMQLNTLGIPALIANVAYNITYQVGVRLPVSLLKTLGENVYRLYDSQYKPETNTFVSQGSFFNKMGLGIKESISQIWTGLNRKDYTQKEIYSQSIRPLHAMKDLWAYAKKGKQLSSGQIVDKALQSTVGIPAEIIGRLLNVGDKPLRFGAEGAQAAVFANQLGLKGMDFKLFLEFPKEEAYRNYIAKGLSPEEAGKKAEIIYNTIIKEGERATFQQDNLANDGISAFFEKLFGSKRSGTGAFVKALAVSPYLKIPINAWWSMYNLLNPEIAVTQSIAYARKGYLEKGKDDIASHASYRQSKYWAAHAAVGIATRAVILQLVSAGIFRPAPTEDDTKKEREGELFYEPQGTFNITKFWAYVNGNDPNSVKHSITIQNRWFGQWGAMGNTISKKYYDATAEQRDNQHGFWDAAFGGMEVEGLKEFQNSVFGGTSSMLDALNGGISGRQYLLSQINMVGNIVDPAMFSQISRAQLPYYSTAKADGFVDELNNSMLQRSSVVRQLEGKYPPSKISIWGEPMQRPGNTFERLFGITPVNKDNFAQPIYEDAKRTGDIGFFPPSVKPEIGDKKLPIDQYNQLQTYIGQARSTLVAPYINDMAEIEVVGKKYSELSDAYKKKTLSYLYTLGQQQGINRFVKEHPEYTKEGKSISQQIDDALFGSWEELKKAENQ